MDVARSTKLRAASCSDTDTAAWCQQSLLNAVGTPCSCVVQAKLQKAQQQREYAKAFHADVLKKMAAEDVAQQVSRRGTLACELPYHTPQLRPCK